MKILKKITGITSHSKKVAPGNLFIAKKAEFIPEAVANGAIAIATDMHDPFLKGIVQIVDPDIDKLEMELVEKYYEHSDKKLFLVGITGTSGKTTTSYLIRHILGKDSCGLIGTIEYIVGKNHLPSTHTTPDLATNHKLFYDMVQHGCKEVVMEVSSHALEQKRVRGIEFDVAVFTNLTQDHLDYHQTMEKYGEAKAKLFSQCKTAVINNDDSYWRGFKGVTYGIDHPADIQATNIRLSANGIEFTVQGIPFKSSLIGRFNIYNCLAAIGVCLFKSMTLCQIAARIRSFKTVEGRLERVDNDKGIHVFVDYSHKEDALKNVLQTLNEIKENRIITVFGCGGDRDQGKRPKMGRVAAELSDLTIVTSDNPRNEDPNQIIKDILSGIKDQKSVLVQPDRLEAITKAIHLAKKGDIVLIAGKGHETYQIFATHTIDFDDREIARLTLMAK